MSNIFRRSYTVPIPDAAELITIKGVPSARFKKNGKTQTAPLTKDGQRMSIESPSWYGWVNGHAVRLFKDAVASRQRLAELDRKSELQESGLIDPFEEHRKRPLAEHLGDWAANLRNRGKGESHILATTSCVRRILEACKFERTSNFSASRIEQFLADLRSDGPALRPLDRAKDIYTKTELAAALGINRTAVASLVRRHRLAAMGKGKARRYPRATVESLREKREHGISIKTSNLYLSGIKAFCNFLVRDNRMAVSPLLHLKGEDPQLDRRHDRRFLDEKELGSVINAAAISTVIVRELSGLDRAMLYRVACTTGFRAGELASLWPKHFDLDEPIVRLPGGYTKNKKMAEQPLPVDVANLLRDYLAGKPANRPIWPGTWYERAADMLRVDLDAAGVPYVVEGGEGPLYADFHCLRHSFVALLDRSGATLKEAMQLARHSDPKLTMKIYGRARRHDLAGAIDRLPSLGEKNAAKPAASA
jgi:integrase